MANNKKRKKKEELITELLHHSKFVEGLEEFTNYKNQIKMILHAIELYNAGIRWFDL